MMKRFKDASDATGSHKVSGMSRGEDGMNNDQKKAVTEWLGECWHEWKYIRGPIRQEEFQCIKCSAVSNPSIPNGLKTRTFTADSDFMACFDRLWELGEMGKFLDFARSIFYNTPEALALLQSEGCGFDDFTIWLHGKNPDGTFHLCELVGEWVKKGEEK